MSSRGLSAAISRDIADDAAARALTCGKRLSTDIAVITEPGVGAVTGSEALATLRAEWRQAAAADPSAERDRELDDLAAIGNAINLLISGGLLS